jgi:hypothetical protein
LEFAKGEMDSEEYEVHVADGIDEIDHDDGPDLLSSPMSEFQHGER